jgi:hypothetical protein
LKTVNKIKSSVLKIGNWYGKSGWHIVELLALLKCHSHSRFDIPFFY